MSEQEIINALGQLAGKLMQQKHSAGCVLFLLMVLVKENGQALEDYHAMAHTFDDRYRITEQYGEAALALVDDKPETGTGKVGLN